MMLRSVRGACDYFPEPSGIVSNGSCSFYIDVLGSLSEESAEDAPRRATSLGPLGSMEGLPPHVDEAGRPQESYEVEPRTGAMPKPRSSVENVHEDDGGLDSICARPQAGICLHAGVYGAVAEM